MKWPMAQDLATAVLASGITLYAVIITDAEENTTMTDETRQSATQPARPGQIATVWKEYFQGLKSLRSLKYNSAVTKWEKGAAQPPVARQTSNEIKGKLARQGSKYCVEIITRQQGQPASRVVTVAYAYDGTYYQVLTLNAAVEGLNKPFSSLTRTRKREADDQSGIVSSIINPLPYLFWFASQDDNPLELEKLQDPKTWNAVEKLITKVEPGTRNQRAGSIVELRGKQGNKLTVKYEIFVDEATGLPWYWKKTLDQTSPNQPEQVECEITKMQEATGAGIAFPLRVEFKEYERSGSTLVPSGGALIEVDPKTLALNTPLNESIFTIPLTRAPLVFEDGNVIRPAPRKSNSTGKSALTGKPASPRTNPTSKK
jgi:hypothetical protein